MHIKKMQCCHIKGLTMECTVCHVNQNNNICLLVCSSPQMSKTIAICIALELLCKVMPCVYL